MNIKKLALQCIVCLATIIPFTEMNFTESQEREFVTTGLARNGAIYTLLSDKPISLFMYDALPRWNLESIYNELDRFAWETLGWIKPEECSKYENVVCWKYWKRRYKLNNSKYCLVEESDKDEISAILINKLTVRKILTKNYELFAAHAGESFDVDKVIERIHDRKSFFWTHIMYSEVSHCPHICLGLLYGFGMENSVAFQKHIDEKEDPLNGIASNSLVQKNNIWRAGYTI